ncbi:hypothetical protein [Nocardioides sp. MH1]
MPKSTKIAIASIAVALTAALGVAAPADAAKPADTQRVYDCC